MSKKHILVISQYFYPEEFRINDICKEWVKRGYEVTVITGIPNYPQGEFYKGYSILKKRKEQYCGINIIRLPIIARGKSSLMLAINYISFAFSGGIWARTTNVKADYVFIFEVSPMTQALPGVWYARKLRIPCYMYMQDLWPDNVEIITGIHNKNILGLLNTMVNYIYKHCDFIFTTSESFRQILIKRHVRADKVVYWPQYAEDCYHAVKKTEKRKEFTIIFTGNIGYAQGLEILLDTAVLLKNEDIRFLLVGDGRYKDKLIEEIKKKDVSSKFEFVGKVTSEEVPFYLSQADVAFVSFMDNPLFRRTIPAKLQSYMACGMPIIAVAAGETKKIVAEANCGICSPLGDPAALARAIRLLQQSNLDAMRKKSLIYYNEKFNKAMLLNQIDLYFRR